MMQIKIEAATILWRESRRCAHCLACFVFFISLSQGSVDLALKQWGDASPHSFKRFDKDLLLTAQRVSTSVQTEQGVIFSDLSTKFFPESWAAYFHWVMSPMFASQRYRIGSARKKPELCKPQVWAWIKQAVNHIWAILTPERACCLNLI